MYKTLGKFCFFLQNTLFQISVISKFERLFFPGGYSWEGLWKNLDSETCHVPSPTKEPNEFFEDEQVSITQKAQEFQIALSSIKQVSIICSTHNEHL